MNVTQAVKTRRSIRAFSDRSVDPAALKTILDIAQLSPSGGNVQPWSVAVMTGAPLKHLIDAVAAKLPLGPAGQSPEYDIYPKDLPEPYRTRRYGVGEAMYDTLGIARDNRMGRMMQMAKNFRAFDAPVCLFIHTPLFMGPPQWADIGMWMQTVMLLLSEAGLDSCPQEAWSLYGTEVRAAAEIPDDHIFFCGLAIGYRDADAPVNGFKVARAATGEHALFIGFDDD